LKYGVVGFLMNGIVNDVPHNDIGEFAKGSPRRGEDRESHEIGDNERHVCDRPCPSQFDYPSVSNSKNFFFDFEYEWKNSKRNPSAWRPSSALTDYPFGFPNVDVSPSASYVKNTFLSGIYDTHSRPASKRCNRQRWVPPSSPTKLTRVNSFTRMSPRERHARDNIMLMKARETVIRKGWRV